jgi:hypothetical protein
MGTSSIGESGGEVTVMVGTEGGVGIVNEDRSVSFGESYSGQKEKG